MKNTLSILLGQLERASVAAKIGMAAAVVALVAVSVFAVNYAGQPHYSMLLSGLDDAESARVGEALAGAGVRWRSSQPPGPFVVYVDDAQTTKARNAVFAAGALKGHTGGILTETVGLSTLLLGSQEREQIMRKRIWEEMERMLELQDFIIEAKVQTMVPDRRVFGKQPEITASVTLVTRGGAELTRAQAHTVARLVRFGLGVSEERLIIADDAGKSVFDGHDLATGAGQTEDWIASAEEADRRLELKASEVLADILGPGLARIVVRSEWDYTRSTTLADRSSAEGAAILSETKRTTSDPRFGDQASGGIAGASSNTGTESFSQSVVGTAGAAAKAPVEPAVAKESHESRVYAPTRTLETTEQRAPRLERLSIALYLDKEVPAESVTAIEDAVKASVGYSSERKDEFKVAQIAFARPEVAEGEAAATEVNAPSPIVQLLLDRAIEIVLAVVFLFMTLKSFRGANKGRKLREKARFAELEQRLQAEAEASRREARELAGIPEEDEVIVEDPAQRSRSRVSALVGEEPEKVGELLTAWVRDDRRISTN